MADNTADAVIIGGGVMGASILYHLCARGVTDVVLLEQSVLGSGSTGRSQAILRMHYSNEVTARLAWESLKLLRSFEEMTGAPSGYVRTGYFLVVGEEDRPALEANVAALKRLGIPTEVLNSGALAEAWPDLVVRDDEAVAYEPESGYADAYSVTTGFANRARELGGRVRQGATATGVEVAGGRVVAVTTAGGRIATPVVVAAAGPWSRPFLRRVGVDLPLETVRHQVVMLRHPDDAAPCHPILGDVVNELSARPDVGHLTLAGAGEDERAGPDDFNQGVDTAVAQRVMAALAARIPSMSQALLRGGWSGLFTVTPDWHPILDRVDGIEGLYCTVGFSGHGFKLSPAVGRAMAELIVDGEATSVDVSPLRLRRFAEGKALRSRYRMSVLA